MSNPQIFVDIIDALYEQALRDYNQGEVHELRQQRSAAMDRQCHDMLTANEQAFVYKCFSQLLEDSGMRERAVYEHGVRDGVAMLKLVGALS